jgi:hypothetical protein
MEQNSQIENIMVVEAQIRECFGRVVYSHKTQEKCADIVMTLHKNLKLTVIILSALVTTSFFIKIFGDNDVSLIIGVVFSTVLFGLNTYTKDYDLGEIAQKHTNAANELWDIRESYLSLLVDIKSGLLSINQIITRRDELQSKLLNVYKGSPRTNSKAYKDASKALKFSEDMTFRNEEIDVFLPLELRKTKTK